MRPLGDSTPGVADQHVEPAEVLDGPLDHRPDLVDVAHVGEHRLDRPAGVGQRGDGRGERTVADVAQHQVGGRLAGEARLPDRDDIATAVRRVTAA